MLRALQTRTATALLDDALVALDEVLAATGSIGYPATVVVPTEDY